MVHKWAQSIIYTYELFFLKRGEGQGALVRLYPINVKTAEPIGPTFCVGPHMTPGKVYGCSELQKVLFNFFVLSKRKCWKIEHIFKVEIEDGHEASW